MNGVKLVITYNELVWTTDHIYHPLGAGDRMIAMNGKLSLSEVKSHSNGRRKLQLRRHLCAESRNLHPSTRVNPAYSNILN
jgi:hypothetical protein